MSELRHLLDGGTLGKLNELRDDLKAPMGSHRRYTKREFESDDPAVVVNMTRSQLIDHLKVRAAILADDIQQHYFGANAQRGVEKYQQLLEEEIRPKLEAWVEARNYVEKLRSMELQDMDLPPEVRKRHQHGDGFSTAQHRRFQRMLTPEND